MTAITDHDHTDHTEHMRRMDHGSDSGDTGPGEHGGHPGSGPKGSTEGDPGGGAERGPKGGAERAGGLLEAHRDLAKAKRGDDAPGTGHRADAPRPATVALSGDEGEGNGEGGHGGEDDGPERGHGKDLDGSRGTSPDAGGRAPARVKDENAGRDDERDQWDRDTARDGRGERDRDGVHGAHGASDRTPDRDRPARGHGAEEGGVSVPRPQPHSPKPRPAPDATPTKTAATADSGTANGAGTANGTAAKAPADTGADGKADSSGAWDDGLIARRVTDASAAALAAERASAAEPAHRGPGGHTPAPLAYDGPLRSRLDALRELVGLSRTRLDSRTLAEAGRVLDEAAARRKLSGRHTVVALAGATGSGKSQLFNALAGVPISETGVRRPTTAAPIACSWSDGAAGLIDRLGIPGRLRRRPLHGPDTEGQLRGLVLVDLPDHDSAAVQHREQVDRILKLVDAVIWVVDPEKYADAVLHERYLRPMAGHAEIMFIVLNQVDRLPGDAADQVLDDLRRLLDEDGIALGEHGEPGATVLALSALTGEGVGDLREALGEFVAERGAAARRVAADVDTAAAELRPVYATGRRVGLSEEAREDFAARLADAVGATAAGEAAERAWLRNANRACGTPWLRLWRWYQGRGDSTTGRHAVRAQADEEATARQSVEQAVRTVSDRASAGLPAPWAQAVREAAVRGSHGLSEALDDLAARAGLPPGRPPRPGWWPVAVLVQAAMTLLQIAGGAWLAGQIAGVMAPNLGVPVLLMVCGIIGGPLVEWACRMAARGPARRYGQEAERRLREAAASCGRARVLDPVAAELLRYREVREQYGRVVRTGSGVR
ncbi:GTPase [Streptomyces sp. NPDC046870]|uniref:GTPase n=1 Tax=Streptomyces sp. NPDC046870 TaxID=3155135 RepID=UPI003451EC1E